MIYSLEKVALRKIKEHDLEIEDNKEQRFQIVHSMHSSDLTPQKNFTGFTESEKNNSFDVLFSEHTTFSTLHHWEMLKL